MAEDRDRSERGFTLLEVIAALAIFTLVISALIKGMAGHLAVVRAVETDERALAVARARLAAAGVETPLADGQRLSGEEQGIAWTMAVTRKAERTGWVDNTGLPVAYWIAVEASWRDGTGKPPRSLRLATIKLGPPQ